MTSNTSRYASTAPSRSGDLWGGFAAMLVALPSSIAFGVLTYTAIAPEYAGVGAMAGTLGAAALGIVAPLVGRTGGLISAPCAPSAAVLSALAAALVAGKQGPAVPPAAIPALFVITALVSALLQIAYGAVGGGKLIKYIPYPVVSGYLSGVGVLIAVGQIPKLLSTPAGTSFWNGLFSPGLWRWESVVVGGATIALMLIAPRLTRKVPAPIIGLSGGVLTYFLLAIPLPALLNLHGNALIIGPISATGSVLEAAKAGMAGLGAMTLTGVQTVFFPAITLSVLLSIDTLKTCVGLDAMTHSRHNSDRELLGQGAANLASCLVGGMPGAGTMGPTLVNITSGGRTPRAGVVSGVLIILALVLLGDLIAWVPIAGLAGILLVTAVRMFDWNMFRLIRTPAGRLDFIVIAGVVLVSIATDLIVAAGTGVAMAILLFIRDQVRGSVIRRKMYLNGMTSKTRRNAAEREILDRYGEEGVFCELQGNLFFGTTDQLFTLLEPDLRSKRYLLLDLRRVQSLDYTAAHLFEQMNDRLASRGGHLLFSGMPSGLLEQRNFEHYLVQLGVVREGGGVMISETMDGALEWIEDRILEHHGVRQTDEERPLEVREFELFREFDEATLGVLASCMTERSLAPGEDAITQGDAGDEMFLVRRGSVRILLPLEGGKHHHLATIGRGDFFGELSFLDRRSRSADVEAKTATELFVLSRRRFDSAARADATLGVRVFARLASTIAVRLRQADAELRVMEER